MEEGERSFTIWTENNEIHFTPKHTAKVGYNIRPVFQPKNFYHKLLKKLGLSYKAEIVGYEYDLEKVESVEGLRI